MKHNKSFKLFPKTFLSSLSLMIGIIVIAFFLIYILTPKFYRAYKEDTLNKDLNGIVSLTEHKDVTEITRLLEEFAASHEYGVTLSDINGSILFSRGIGMMIQQTDSINGGAEDHRVLMTSEVISFEQTLTATGKQSLSLNLYSSMQPIDEANTVILRVLPYVLLISLGLAAAVSFLYAKTITAPVKAISKATFQMRTLERNAACNVKSSDEIGELAGNINELYSRLLSTINDLQKEIHNVTAADKEKIDFMLTVSHELKTPLTAVKGMVEGMIYNVGVYKDRDKYLNHCGESIDALTELLNEILNASKLELSPSSDDFSNTNIQKLVKDTVTTYEMIALSKQVNIEIHIDEDRDCSLPTVLFSKALSNIISNAVKYADEGGTVDITADNRTLVIENTCTPLSQEELRRVFEPFYSGGQGHGLGLYLTKRILRVCDLPFEFVPFSIGMRFTIYIE